MSELDDGPPAERVFLVVVDDSEEQRAALRYASRRAWRTGGRVALLRVIAPAEFQHFAAIGQLMSEEARADAEALLQRLGTEVQEISGKLPVIHVREGDAREEVIALIEQERSIAILVLAADTGAGGPGPLVLSLTGSSIGKLRIPMAIVPGTLTDREIDALT